jgi:hypothetical protein
MSVLSEDSIMFAIEELRRTCLVKQLPSALRHISRPSQVEGRWNPFWRIIHGACNTKNKLPNMPEQFRCVNTKVLGMRAHALRKAVEKDRMGVARGVLDYIERAEAKDRTPQRGIY